MAMTPACYIRPMRREDVPQVNQIDREAFPTQWPPPNYDRELKDAISHHIVAGEETAIAPETKPEETALARLMRGLKRLLGGAHSDGNKPVAPERVLGFASLWMMADEAHLTNIAVRQDLQRQGIGELLLISVIELAAEIKADYVTLEVRVSNTIALGLYKKYGFAEVGIRRSYYTDNREDARIMSTESIKLPSFQERLWQLKEAYLKRYGHRNDLERWNRNAFISAKPPSSAPSR